MCRSVRSENRDVLFKKGYAVSFFVRILISFGVQMSLHANQFLCRYFFFFLFCLLAFLFCFVLFSFLFLVKKIATSGKRESMKKPLSMCR